MKNVSPANKRDAWKAKLRPDRAVANRQVSRVPITLIFAILVTTPCIWSQSSAGSVGENQRFSYGAETDFSSNYVWRGILVDDGPVMQPSAWLSFSDFTLIGWSNLNLTQTPRSRRLDATNLTVAYDRMWKELAIEPTLEVYLGRPAVGFQDPNTLEGALNLSFPAGPLRLFTKQSVDLLAYRGAYFGQAGAAYEGRLTNSTAFAVSLRSGWSSSRFNAAYIGADKPAFNFVGVKGSITHYVRRSWYLRPHVEFDRTVDPQLRQFLLSPSVFSFGLEIGCRF